VPQPAPSPKVSQETLDGKEVFRVSGLAAGATPVEATPPPAPALELDDLNASVEVGALCRRKGCSTAFVSDEVNRQGDGEGTVCHHHPLPVRQPIRPFYLFVLNEKPLPAIF